jgi:hypothetical protein
MIENGSGAVDVKRSAVFFSDAFERNVFAVKLTISVMKRMHRLEVN